MKHQPCQRPRSGPTGCFHAIFRGRKDISRETFRSSQMAADDLLRRSRKHARHGAAVHHFAPAASGQASARCAAWANRRQVPRNVAAKPISTARTLLQEHSCRLPIASQESTGIGAPMSLANPGAFPSERGRAMRHTHGRARCFTWNIGSLSRPRHQRAGPTHPRHALASPTLGAPTPRASWLRSAQLRELVHARGCVWPQTLSCRLVCSLHSGLPGE